MSKQNNRLLLLVQNHAHAASLMDCITFIRANFGWCWVVYSPAVLADPATVEKEFDQQITELSRAMKEASGREDFAGAESYKAKRDAAILDKSVKVKDAYKSLSKEQQNAAEDQIFGEFWRAIQSPPESLCTISRHADHFETTAHVEFQNALKAGMKPGYVPGEYVVAWPTSLPKGGQIEGAMSAAKDLMKEHFDAATEAVKEKIPAEVEARAQERIGALKPGNFPPTVKIDKRTKEYKARLKELSAMGLDDLGPIAFELGIKPTDPIAGKTEALIEKIIELEQTAADVSKY